jgi:hypothetical protein
LASDDLRLPALHLDIGVRRGVGDRLDIRVELGTQLFREPAGLLRLYLGDDVGIQSRSRHAVARNLHPLEGLCHGNGDPKRLWDHRPYTEKRALPDAEARLERRRDSDSQRRFATEA